MVVFKGGSCTRSDVDDDEKDDEVEGRLYGEGEGEETDGRAKSLKGVSQV